MLYIVPLYVKIEMYHIYGSSVIQLSILRNMYMNEREIVEIMTNSAQLIKNEIASFNIDVSPLSGKCSKTQYNRIQIYYSYYLKMITAQAKSNTTSPEEANDILNSAQKLVSSISDLYPKKTSPFDYSVLHETTPFSMGYISFPKEEESSLSKINSFLDKIKNSKEISPEEAMELTTDLLQKMAILFDNHQIDPKELDDTLNEMNGRLLSIKNKYKNEPDDDISAKKIQDDTSNWISNNISPDSESLTKIIKKVGKNAWNKLDERSKDFLTMAEYLEKVIEKSKFNDYSSVCISACKAFEIEITKRFLDSYKTYLINSNIPNPETYITNKNGHVIEPDTFTLGDVKSITGYSVDKNTVFLLRNIEENNTLFLDYAQNNLYKRPDRQNVINTVKKHVRIINTTRTLYRNPSAHKDVTPPEIAEECLKYLIEKQRSLGVILDDCNY